MTSKMLKDAKWYLMGTLNEKAKVKTSNYEVGIAVKKNIQLK